MVKWRVIIILFLSFLRSASQDAFFYNTNQSLVYLNPSFAGSNGGFRNQFSIRNQWPNLAGALVTYNNSSDCYIPFLNAGIALSFFDDDQTRGTTRTSFIKIAYAQHLRLNSDIKIIPSLEIGVGNKVVDRTKLNFGDMIDSRRKYSWNVPGRLPTVHTPMNDINASLLLSGKNLLAGVSVKHINRPKDNPMGAGRLPVLLTAHASYNVIMNEKSMLHLSAVMMRQDAFVQMRLNSNLLLYKHWIIGLGMWNEGAIANAGYKGRWSSVQLTYDRAIGRKAGNTASSYEIHFSLNFRKKNERDTLCAFEKW